MLARIFSRGSCQRIRGWLGRSTSVTLRRSMTSLKGVIDQEWVQMNLARVYAGLEFLRLINWKVAWSATQGELDVADASTTSWRGSFHRGCP